MYLYKTLVSFFISFDIIFNYIIPCSVICRQVSWELGNEFINIFDSISQGTPCKFLKKIGQKQKCKDVTITALLLCWTGTYNVDYRYTIAFTVFIYYTTTLRRNLKTKFMDKVSNSSTSSFGIFQHISG